MGELPNGKLKFPAGHLDPQESPRDGAQRELKEETNLGCDGLKCVGIQQHETGNLVHFFVADANGVMSVRHDPDEEFVKLHLVDLKNTPEEKHSHPFKSSPFDRYLNTLNKSELEKMSRPRLSFPNFPKVTTRPDQEIKRYTEKEWSEPKYRIPHPMVGQPKVGLSHAALVEGRKVNNSFNNATDKTLNSFQQERNLAEIGLSNTIQNYYSDNKGPPTEGMVNRYDPQKVIHGSAMDSGSMIGHEGNHYLFADLKRKANLSDQQMSDLYSKMTSHIHPNDLKGIDQSLSDRGYQAHYPTYPEERINAVHDYISNPKMRAFELHRQQHQGLNQKRGPHKPIDVDRLKQSWNNIVDTAKKYKG